MDLVGIAWSWNVAEWRLGWRQPEIAPGVAAGPVDGDIWLCLGPLALIFEGR
jgi:hypothetical protein